MNVACLLEKSSVAYAHATAVISEQGELSYRELNARAAAFGDGLRVLGLSRGDRVVIYMTNSSDYFVALFGIFSAGMVAVPVSIKLHLDELDFIVNDAEAAAVVVGPEGGEDVLERLRTRRSQTTPLPTIITTGTTGSIHAVIKQGSSEAHAVEVSPDALCWLFYTSGTTGRPKGAMLTHRNLTAMTVNCLADMYSFQPEDTVLHVAPLSHGSGLYSLPPISRGATSVIMPSGQFDAEAVLRCVDEMDVTVIAFVVPTMITLLTRSSYEGPLPSLRAVIYGGAPIHEEHAREALRRFGKRFIQMYGLGEAPMTISSLRALDHDLDDPGALTSAGLPRTDVELSIVGEDDLPLARGEVGEVVMRGDVVMAGYWGNPEATADTLRGGWLHTRDIGRIDERGRLVLLDRMGDVIISGGANIYPREVEEVLARHPAVSEVAVFGVPDDVWGETVAAAIVLKDGTVAAEEELIQYCRENIASYKKPRVVEFRASLPKNAYGKVLRRTLRDSYTRAGER